MEMPPKHFLCYQFYAEIALETRFVRISMRKSVYKGVSNGKSMENQFIKENQLKIRPKIKHFSLFFWTKK